MKRFNLEHLKGDLSGGFVAGIIALPLALAFGVQSGLGAEAGLYGAIAVGIFAALFGGTATQASGPTGPMTVISASIVIFATEAKGSIEAGLGIVLLCFLVGGILQLVLGVLGIGQYIRYFPYPVVSGFMSGVGIIIILLQLWPLMGSPSPKSTWQVITGISQPLANLNVAAVAIGLLTLAVNYTFPKLTKKVPSVLVALLVGTGTALLLRLDVPTIGDIPSGFPSLRLGTFLNVEPQYFGFILQSGVTLALLGSIDSLLTSVIADNLTKDRHDSRRELIGQGIGNTIAALFGGIPGAGSTKGTVVNINAGAKTRLSGVTHGLFQLAALLGLGSFASYIPLPVLAGLLISVGIAIIDYKGIRHLPRIPKSDAVVMVVVLIWTVFGNLIYAVAAGVALASLLFMKRIGDLAETGTTMEVLDPDPVWVDEVGKDNVEPSTAYIKHLYGPLFFGFASGFRDLFERLPPQAKTIILRMERVPYIDQSGLYTLDDVILRLTTEGKQVVLTGLKPQVADMLDRVGLVPNLVPRERVFDEFDECVAWLRQQRTNPTPTPLAATP